MSSRPDDPRRSGPTGPLPAQEQTPPGSEARMSPAPDFGEKSYRGHGRLQGRTALVTGGDSGIGRAVALAFAREGADVAISYWNEHEDAERTRQVIEASGRHALLLPGDLTDPAHCRRVVALAVERFGRLDVLVNNAAFQGREAKSITEIDPERLERTFRTNILAMFHLSAAALAHLPAGGVIVNTTSIQAYNPSPPILDYASTKGAIVTFTKGLAHELAPRGIRVNAVAPGPVWTPLIPQSFDASHVQKHGQSAPLGRTAQPAELAPAYVFLACDESRFITGEILGVTGGGLLA